MGNLRTKDLSKIGYHNDQLRSLVIGMASKNFKHQLETCRSSGPGGQNVNKVETAARGAHVPSGIQVMAMDTRSQLENKKLCMARLEAKVLVWQTEQLMEQQQSRWQEHNELERGNPVKIIKADLF